MFLIWRVICIRPVLRLDYLNKRFGLIFDETHICSQCVVFTRISFCRPQPSRKYFVLYFLIRKFSKVSVILSFKMNFHVKTRVQVGVVFVFGGLIFGRCEIYYIHLKINNFDKNNLIFPSTFYFVTMNQNLSLMALWFSPILCYNLGASILSSTDS